MFEENITNITNITTQAPPPPSPANDALNGVCDKFNSNFIIVLSTVGVALLMIIVCSWLKNAKPTPGKVSYGLPYHVMAFFSELALWNTLPNVVIFIVFKVATEDMLPDTSAMACVTTGTSLPILAFYFLLIALTFLVTSNTTQICETCHKLLMTKTQVLNSGVAIESSPLYPSSETGRRNSDESLPEQIQSPAEGDEQNNFSAPPPAPETTKSNAPKILVIGAMQRGAVFAEYRKEVLEKYPNAEVANLIFTGTENHVKNNLLAFGGMTPNEDINKIVYAPPALQQADIYQFWLRTEEHKDEHKAVKSGKNGDQTVLIAKGGKIPSFFDTEQLGLPHDHFDEIVLLPFLRTTSPIGGFLTQEENKMLRMVDMLRSVSNVLKPGGYLTAIDVIRTGVLVERDIVDAGIYTNIKIQEDKGTVLGAIGFRSEVVIVTARKKNVDAVSRARLSTTEAANFALMDKPTEVFMSENAKIATICTVQLIMYTGLLFLAAGLFHPLDWPERVPLGQRFGNIFVSVSGSYVLIGYIFRQALTEAVPATDVWMLVKIVLKSDALVILGSFLFTVLFFLPTFLLMLALAETSLSNDIKSIIGILISIYIGIFGFKRGKKSSEIKTLKARGIDEGMVNRLVG